MEFASTIFGNILSKAGEYLAEPIIRPGRYLFRFKSIVEDLKKENKNLRLAQDRVQKQVDIARRNTEEIEEDVQKWLMDVSRVAAIVQSLENEINANESRLNGWCPNWGCKYKLSRRAAKQTSILLKLQDAGKFNKIAHPTILPGIEFLAPKDFMIFESTKSAFDGIIEALKDDETSIVGLYGMGGIGKTTLAKAVGKATKEQKLFDEVIMVFVSQVVDIIKIQEQIAESLSLKLGEKTELARAKRLFLRLKKENKILLILDNVWTMLDLRTIGIPYGDEHIGCKIFITTRVEQVCIAMKCRKRVPLNVLNQNEGMDLFKKHAEIGDSSPMLSDTAKRVVKECSGLPLAIVTIGSLLRDKDANEWEVVYQKLKKSKLIDLEGVDTDVYACLKMSYDYLKGEETKFCFLLCSLFPEDDYKIDLEVLLRFGLGLDLFQDAESIEDARSQLQVTIENLKASCLLSGSTNRFVMHDLVRDVALWIASKGENVFVVKAGMRLAEWPQHKDIELCTAISLMRSKIEVFPNQLICPKLKILLLDGDDDDVSNEFFEAMKALKVASLKWFRLSLNSLQSLTNLVTLRLINCKLRDMSSLKMLAKLKILIFRGCELVELPEELRELNKLRILSITQCFSLKRIPVNVIPSLSRLEELYIDGSFKAWEVEGTSAESSNACLSELNELHRLTTVLLSIEVHKCLPKNFILLKKLHKYEIRVNHEDSSKSNVESRSLAIRDIEATSLFTFKSLYENVEYLELYNIRGCCQNIVPSIDETGLYELKRLSLQHFQGVECIIDMTQQHVPSTIFSNLVHLSLSFVDLREICNGGRPPRGFLENLEIVQVRSCDRMSCLFPILLIQRLRKLKAVTIYECDVLQDVFQLEGISCTKENPPQLSSLASLHLGDLPNMRNIWKGPTQQISLQSLTVVEVAKCKKLKYIFTLNLAQSLLQLQQLKVSDCESLEHIVEIKAGETENNIAARARNDVVFPKLRKLEVIRAGLINFCSENYCLTWPALQELMLRWTPSLVAELEANLQTAKKTLRFLQVERSEKLCCVVLLKNAFENLEELRISYCRGVQVIFQLEQQFSPSILKKLNLVGLEELECLYKGPTHLLSFPNLQKLVVRMCKRLRHLLSSSLARNLLQLKRIYIYHCGELEQVMVEDDREDHVQLPLFPNLSSMCVSRCHKLKALFPVTVARLDLQQLTYLQIRTSPQLEEIFGHKDEADMTGDNELELVLPQFEKLALDGLESLVNFCPSGYHLIFPSLSFLRVSDCPKITTRFSVDENGAVHAQTKAPHTDNQCVVDMQHSPSETARDIFCEGSDDLRQMLPPYIGK